MTKRTTVTVKLFNPKQLPRTQTLKPHRRFFFSILGFLFFFIPYATILTYFHRADIYNEHFFDEGITGNYNLARTVFIFYCWWIICCPGYILLTYIDRSAKQTYFTLPQRLAASFFLGAGAWHIFLFILGILNLYYYWIMICFSTLSVAVAYIYVRELTQEIHNHIARDRATTFRNIERTALVAIFAVLATILLVVKGLYPAGGHDFFNHYHGYYEAVLRNHGIWPNEVWYQYYYSKGMGLFFFGMYLTDPLAPSLVTYCFAIGVALVVYLMVRNASSPATLWPWLAATAYVALYIYTPGRGAYLANGGWGDFQKPHEIGAAFVVAIVWMCSGIVQADNRFRRGWFCSCAVCLFAVAFIETVTSFVLGLFVGLVMIGLFVVGRRRDAMTFLWLGMVTGLGVVTVFGASYVMSGLPNDQLVVQVWPIANVRLLNEWGALPNVIALIQGLVELPAAGIPWFSDDQSFFLAEVFRFDALKVIMRGCASLCAVCLIAALLLSRTSRAKKHASIPLVIMVFLVAFLAATLGPGMIQNISFVRYSSYCLPIILAFVCAGAGAFSSWLFAPGWLNFSVSTGYPIILLILTFAKVFPENGPAIKAIVENGMRFASGALSIREAYGDQRGWPGRTQYGAIYPGMVDVWKIVGPNTRLWSMHLLAYCMLPYCREETAYSFILSHHFMDILDGSPEFEKQIFQKEHLNYFFFTTALDINDVLPLTPLFLPEHISEYLGVKWTDGTSYLLTWLGPGVTSLTPEWVAQYVDMVKRAPVLPAGYPISVVKSVREELLLNPHWGAQLPLPGLLPR